MALLLAMMMAVLMLPTVTCGQEPCDPSKIKELEKKFRKTIKGRGGKEQLTQTHGGATIAFELAQCHVNVNDSMYRHWLEVAIERVKISPSCFVGQTILQTRIYHIGLYYYLLGNMEQAEIWSSKYLKWAPQEPLAHYRHALALLGLQRYAESMAAFTKAQELGGDMPDLGELIERCRAGLHTTH